MGLSNSKLEDYFDKLMESFFYRVIPHEYIVTHIEDYLEMKSSNYYDFQCLIKIIGIHDDLHFQNNFWERCYVWHKDKYGIDGILLVPLLLCQGDKYLKLNYIKEYMSKYINHSNDYNGKSLIMNLTEFQNIIFTFFCCLCTVPISCYESKHKGNKQKLIDEETRKLEQLKQIYSKENIEIFTKKQIKPYSRKNFYVNAGKWFSDKIEWLIDDKKIRESIKKFRKFDDKLSSTNEEIEEDDEQIPENEINGNAPPQYQKNTK